MPTTERVRTSREDPEVPAPERGPLSLTPLEAALLVLAAFFAVGAARAPLAARPSLPAWLAAQTGPPLVLLAGAALVARRYAGLVPRVGPRPRALLAAGGAFCAGLGGGACLVPPTAPASLAPGLGEAGRLLWSLGWVGLCAPAAEEAYFRGALFGSVKQAWGSAAAVGISSLLFALAHLTAGPAAWPFALGLGLALGIVRAATGSLLAAAAAHAGWNIGTIGHTYLPGCEAGAAALLAVGATLTALGVRRNGREESE